MKRILIAAGGTGGHIFPALAVADDLADNEVDIQWVGSPKRMESRIVAPRYPLHLIDVGALRGQGWRGLLKAPWRLFKATCQAWQLLRRWRPDAILAMGGFVCGPVGVAARLQGIPLLVHEQNAIAGMTNRYLAKWAAQVLQAFPGAFAKKVAVKTVGNPIRADLLAAPSPRQRGVGGQASLRVLVVGGSQGARAINQMLLRLWQSERFCRPLSVRHQTGEADFASVQAAYQNIPLDAVVAPFIEDMAAAYAWADVVICRAGALTVSELAAVGVASILIPFPAAVDNHQRYNAAYLADADAAFLVVQDENAQEKVATALQSLANEPSQCLRMAEKARALAVPDATQVVANICQHWMKATA